MQAEPVRTERLLDHGWSFVSRLHQWLSAWPLGSNDRIELNELIRDVQVLWTSADDLGLRELTRTCLLIEQFLERFCARKFEWSPELLADITAAISVLQDLLLGFEATREEPTLEDLTSLQKLEQRVRNGFYSSPVQTEIGIPDEISTDPVLIPASNSASLVHPTANETLNAAVDDSLDQETHDRIEWSMLEMLQDFVAKIEEICQRLHKRVFTEQAPYSTTTSRLEHLAQSTRELVEKMTEHSSSKTSFAMRVAVERFNANDSPLNEVGNDALEESLSLDIKLAQKSVDDVFSPIQLAETDELATSCHQPPDGSYESESHEEVAQSHPVVIIEESLFYRHLMVLAVRSAGYECVTVEPASPELQQLLDSGPILAIGISLNVSDELLQTIKEFRMTRGVPVIGLVDIPREDALFDVDDRVAKSQPGQLIASLHRLLSDSTDDTRKIA